ncbi:MAG: hypothetical protein HYT98_01115 [Candidatus Sungbacteria bacterium]|nr:hypothetical protein [Candidatus Sungbacteria bacterium]
MEIQNLNLKLKETANTYDALARISKIFGVVQIQKLFPEETDPELSTLYIIQLNPIIQVDPVLLEQVLTALRQDPDVEYAEMPPHRKLI